MHFSRCSLLKPLFLAAVTWLSGAVLAQSLAIRKDANGYQIDVTLQPGNPPQTLQASENFRLWIDLHENITGPYSHALTNARNFRYFRLKSTETAPPIRVLFLGDSLTQDGSGWGSGMYDYFKPNATVINYGMANTGTKVFLRSAEKDNMLLIKPDYVLLNYGFIDNAVGDPRAFTTHEEFEANLRTIAGMVRGFGGVPIFVAVQMPRIWDENGKVTGGWAARNEISKRVAADFDAPYIDFEQITREVYNELGPSGCAFMNLTPTDYLHFSAPGAKYIARYLVNALPEDFGPYLTGIFDPPPVP